MRQARSVMGMPVTVEVVDAATDVPLSEVFTYLTHIDLTFSTYQAKSEINRLNRGEITLKQASPEVRAVLALAEDTKRITGGFFDVQTKDGFCDPSGLVKGWAILQAAELLRTRGFENFYVEAGGDIQAAGSNSVGEPWRVGIRNPFNLDQIVKIVAPQGLGVATSGTYLRGQHIYNPKNRGERILNPVSLTVLGPNVYEADRFATAAFAMGLAGIAFLEQLPGFEGYQIDHAGQATLTSGFGQYVV